MSLRSVFFLSFSGWCLCWGAVSAAHASQPQQIRIEIFVDKIGYEQSASTDRQSTERQQQFVTTLDGYEATIFVGKHVPNVTVLRKYLLDKSYLDYAVQFVNVGTRLKVLPRVQNGMIELVVTPQISYENPSSSKEKVIEVRELATTVLAASGQTIELGRFSQETEFYEDFYRNERGERITIFVRPVILE